MKIETRHLLYVSNYWTKRRRDGLYVNGIKDQRTASDRLGNAFSFTIGIHR